MSFTNANDYKNGKKSLEVPQFARMLFFILVVFFHMKKDDNKYRINFDQGNDRKRIDRVSA